MDCVVKVNAFGVGPVDIPTISAEPILIDSRLHSWKGSCHYGLDTGIDRRLLGASSLCSCWAIVVVEGKHKVVGPSVHLDWEDSRLVRKGFETHLVYPWLEIKSVNWWNCIVFLTFLNNIVILSRRVNSEHHSLSTENSGVVPTGLNERLSNIVEVIKETGLFFYISVSQLVSNHVLLSNSKRSHIIKLFRLFRWVLCHAKSLRWSVRALSTNLEHKLDVLSVPGNFVV